MKRLGKWSTAIAVGLILGLMLCTTGAFAQDVSQQIERGNMSISAHKAVEQSGLQFVAQRPANAQGNWGWGNNCGGNGCFHGRSILRCSSQRECHTVQECRWTNGVRVCRGYKVCRFRSICRRCFNNGWGGPSSWAVKQH